jgi:hypothetical protein
MRQRDFSAKSGVDLSYAEARLIRLRRRDAGGRQGRSMRRSILVAVFLSGMPHVCATGCSRNRRWKEGGHMAHRPLGFSPGSGAAVR